MTWYLVSVGSLDLVDDQRDGCFEHGDDVVPKVETVNHGKSERATVSALDTAYAVRKG
jgi:hypothetical protein